MMKPGSIAVLAMGALGIVAGVLIRAFRPTWGSWGDATMLGGGLFLVAFFWVERLAVRKLAGTRQARYGANTAVYSIVVGAILGVVNFVATQHSQRVDLTDEKLHTLSDQTRKVLGGLERDIAITAFYPELDPETGKARQLLERYGHESSRITFEVVDPQSNPRLAQEKGITHNMTTVFESGEERTEVTGVSEEAFTNALIKLSRSTHPRIYFTEGHGEIPVAANPQRSVSQAVELSKSKSYDVDTVNLATTAEVPRDATLLVLARPERPLGAHALAVLESYLNEGGRALVLLEPTLDGGLSDLLKRRGVTIRDDFVVDPSATLMGGTPEMIMVTPGSFNPHPITQGFPFTVDVRLARSVVPDPDPPLGFQSRQLFSSGPASWSETDLQSLNPTFTPEEDQSGPIPLAVVSTWQAMEASTAPDEPTPPAEAAGPGEPEPVPEADPADDGKAEPAPPAEASTETATEEGGVTDAAPTPPEPADERPATDEEGWEPVSSRIASKEARSEEGRLVVVGDADWATDVIFAQPSFGNGPLWVNTISWLAETEELIAVPPKRPGNYQVSVSRAQGYGLATLVLFVVPGGILTFGFSTWWRRRRL